MTRAIAIHVDAGEKTCGGTCQYLRPASALSNAMCVLFPSTHNGIVYHVVLDLDDDRVPLRCHPCLDAEERLLLVQRGVRWEVKL